MGDAAVLDARLKGRLWRILVASVVMGAVLWGLAMAMAPLLALPTVRYVALMGLVAAGIVAYFAAGFAIGAFRMAELRSAFRR